MGIVAETMTGEVQREAEKARKLKHENWNDFKTKDKSIGKKFDNGKLPWTLLPFTALAKVVEVLEFGAIKYGKDNWKHVENAKERYTDAAFRHLVSYADGETYDSESGKSHLAHAICCLLFLLFFEGK